MTTMQLEFVYKFQHFSWMDVCIYCWCAPSRTNDDKQTTREQTHQTHHTTHRQVGKCHSVSASFSLNGTLYLCLLNNYGIYLFNKFGCDGHVVCVCGCVFACVRPFGMRNLWFRHTFAVRSEHTFLQFLPNSITTLMPVHQNFSGDTVYLLSRAALESAVGPVYLLESVLMDALVSCWCHWWRW